jgi:hypothetical protein
MGRMSLKPAIVRNRMFIMMWLALALVCVALTGTGMAIKVEGPRVDALEGDQVRTNFKIQRALRDVLSGESPELLYRQCPLMYRELNGPVLEQAIVDVSPLKEGFAGWKARVTFGSGWRNVTPIPPELPHTLSNWLGKENTRRLATQTRKLILILCGTVWSVAFVLLPVAGPWRRQLGQFCIAASVLALAAWASDDNHPRLLSVPAPDWIMFASLAGLVAGVVAVVIPIRSPMRRMNHCRVCDYDLTGNVSGICPECGNPTPTEIRRRRDAQLVPLAEAIRQTVEEVTVYQVDDLSFKAPIKQGESG